MNKQVIKEYFQELMSKIFCTGYTFKFYYTSGYKNIDKCMGVYSVVAPSNFKIELLDKIQGVNTELSNLLPNPCDRCNKDYDNKYLYIGKAVNLRNRIRKYVKHDIKQHKGGYPIWFLNNNQDLYIFHTTIDNIKDNFFDCLYTPANEIYNQVNQVKSTDIAVSIESALNELHRLAYDNLPFANSDNDKTPNEYKLFWNEYWKNYKFD